MGNTSVRKEEGREPPVMHRLPMVKSGNGQGQVPPTEDR